MKEVLVLKETSHCPYTLAGKCAGECWGADTSDDEKNKKRGKKCFESGHMRTAEFPQVFLIIDGYSARVIREFYTHIGCLPTRLQSSTRYVDAKSFKYVTPPSVFKNEKARQVYDETMEHIREGYTKLEELGIKREDAAMVLPLGMETVIVDKRNFRNLVDMAKNRMCTRAYWEYRQLMNDICEALSSYSGEWNTLIKLCMKPKCEISGYCTESKSCGRKPKKE